MFNYRRLVGSGEHKLNNAGGVALSKHKLRDIKHWASRHDAGGKPCVAQTVISTLGCHSATVMPESKNSPGCGAQVDAFGDDAFACPRTGLLARRAKILERAWAFVARGGRPGWARGSPAMAGTDTCAQC